MSNPSDPDELHDGYYYNGEERPDRSYEIQESKPAPKYRWHVHQIAPGFGEWTYERLATSEIVCKIISDSGSYRAGYPVMKTYTQLAVARAAVEERFK